MSPLPASPKRIAKQGMRSMRTRRPLQIPKYARKEKIAFSQGKVRISLVGNNVSIYSSGHRVFSLCFVPNPVNQGFFVLKILKGTRYARPSGAEAKSIRRLLSLKQIKAGLARTRFGTNFKM